MSMVCYYWTKEVLLTNIRILKLFYSFGLIFLDKVSLTISVIVLFKRVTLITLLNIELYW